MELAKRIMIFPAELREAAEGSFMMDAAADATTHSSMTSASYPAASQSNQNLLVQKFCIYISSYISESKDSYVWPFASKVAAQRAIRLMEEMRQLDNEALVAHEFQGEIDRLVHLGFGCTPGALNSQTFDESLQIASVGSGVGV